MVEGTDSKNRTGQERRPFVSGSGELNFVEVKNLDTEGSMLIVGFPTHGLVGSIAAGYLALSLKMDLVGYITGEALPPTVMMEEGVAASPIRIYASGTVCGPDKKCNQLLVAISDLQPETALLNPLGSSLLDWAESRGVSLVMVIEGRPVAEGKEADPERTVAIANRAGLPVLRSCGFPPASGQMTGIGGAILRASLGRKIPVLCIIPETTKDQPDARAAAKVVESLQPMVPALSLDPGPLLDQAHTLEQGQRKGIAQQKGSIQSLQGGTPEGMYR